ncbi:MAG: DUF1638 domain-containing protein [Pseudomonadota bacterium]
MKNVLAPDEARSFRRGAAKKEPGSTLLIACGALAREIVQLIELNGWSHLDVTCLPAKLHNEPEKIPEAVREKIRAARHDYELIRVVYADCGTGGLLDAVCAEEGVERIDGPHCYAFFSGNAAFEARGDADMTAFFLTDYLVRHFDKLIWEGFGLDRRADMREFLFGNYERVVYLAQIEDQVLESEARAIADRLALTYEYRFTGFGDLESFMQPATDTPTPLGS